MARLWVAASPTKAPQKAVDAVSPSTKPSKEPRVRSNVIPNRRPVYNPRAIGPIYKVNNGFASKMDPSKAPKLSTPVKGKAAVLSTISRAAKKDMEGYIVGDVEVVQKDGHEYIEPTGNKAVFLQQDEPQEPPSPINAATEAAFEVLINEHDDGDRPWRGVLDFKEEVARSMIQSSPGSDEFEDASSDPFTIEESGEVIAQEPETPETPPGVRLMRTKTAPPLALAMARAKLIHDDTVSETESDEEDSPESTNHKIQRKLFAFAEPTTADEDKDLIQRTPPSAMAGHSPSWSPSRSPSVSPPSAIDIPFPRPASRRSTSSGSGSGLRRHSDSESLASMIARAREFSSSPEGSPSASPVYTHSPLCLVTDIEEAHLIDDIVDGEEEPLLDVYEMKMIADIEQEELGNYTDLDESAREAGADTEMDAEVKRMLVEEAKENVPAYLRLSKGECEELYLEWKSQQNEEAETTANNDAALDDTVDTWEKDTDDEEDSESWSFCPDYNEDEMSFSITRPSTASSASTDGEELDSNNVTVGDEEQVVIKIVEARDSHDEGYISLSPPITPTTDNFPKANEKTWFFPTTTRLSVSSFRRQTHAWTESMDSLKAFRATTINEAAVDDALEDDEQTHEAGKLDITEEKSQGISKVDTDNDGPLEAIDHPELGEPFVAPADSASSPTKGEAVEPETVDTNDVSVSATAAATHGRDIATTKYAPLSTVQLGLKPQIRKASLLPTLHSQGTLIYADESHPTGAALNGVLNHAFKFPADSELPLLIDQAHNEIDTDSDGPSKAIDLPTHRYNGPVVAENKPSPDTKHIKNKPSTTDYLAGAVSTGWFYMGIVRWTTVGIVVAGVVVNGLVKLVRRR
jgi:hypothetical protein